MAIQTPPIISPNIQPRESFGERYGPLLGLADIIAGSISKEKERRALKRKLQGEKERGQRMASVLKTISGLENLETPMAETATVDPIKGTEFWIDFANKIKEQKLKEKLLGMKLGVGNEKPNEIPTMPEHVIAELQRPRTEQEATEQKAILDTVAGQYGQKIKGWQRAKSAENWYGSNMVVPILEPTGLPTILSPGYGKQGSEQLSDLDRRILEAFFK